MSRPTHAPEPEGLLAQFRDTVASLFDEFRKAETSERRRDLAGRICHLVEAQCAAEEELLYPEAARLTGVPDNRIRAAQLEVAFVRKVVDQVRSLPHDDRRFVFTVEILHDYVRDYVEQQRSEVLPRLRRAAGAGVKGLYQAMLTRRQQLLGDTLEART